MKTQGIKFSCIVMAPVFIILLFTIISGTHAQNSNVNPTTRGPVLGTDIMLRLDQFEHDHAQIAARQEVLAKQMDMVLEVRRQVFEDHQNLMNVIERVRIHEAAQLNDPAVIASLQTKTNWALSGIGLLITGSIGWMFLLLKKISMIAEFTASENLKILREELKNSKAEEME